MLGIVVDPKKLLNPGVENEEWVDSFKFLDFLTSGFLTLLGLVLYLFRITFLVLDSLFRPNDGEKTEKKKLLQSIPAMLSVLAEAETKKKPNFKFKFCDVKVRLNMVFLPNLFLRLFNRCPNKMTLSIAVSS